MLLIITSIYLSVVLTFCCSFCLSRASAETSLTPPPTMTLKGRLEFPNKTPFNITNARISFNNEEYHTYSHIDGSFVIFESPPAFINSTFTRRPITLPKSKSNCSKTTWSTQSVWNTPIPEVPNK